MNATMVEYLDFSATEAAREYRLLVRRGTDIHHFTVSIPNEAFLAGRARYQDAPDICYLKLLKEVEGSEEGALPEPDLEVSDQELEDYRAAHTPKSSRRR